MKKDEITVSKSVLKAKMLEYFRKLEKNGVPIIVTSHGKPSLRITRVSEKITADEAFKELRSQGYQISDEDLLAPETEEWGDFV